MFELSVYNINIITNRDFHFLTHTSFKLDKINTIVYIIPHQIF